MKTKIRISIWIMALSLVFLGVGLSSRQALAASGLSTQRAANISVYYSQRSLASIFSLLPAIGVAPTELSAFHWQEMERITAPFYAASASIGVALTELSAAHWQEMERITAPIYAASASTGVGLSALSATALGEQSLIKGYRLQAIERFSGAVPSTGVILTTLSSADVLAYRWQALASFYATHPYAGIDLTKLSAADVSAYRWQAMAHYYMTHPKPWR